MQYVRFAVYLNLTLTNGFKDVMNIKLIIWLRIQKNKQITNNFKYSNY